MKWLQAIVFLVKTAPELIKLIFQLIDAWDKLRQTFGAKEASKRTKDGLKKAREKKDVRELEKAFGADEFDDPDNGSEVQ